MEVSSLAMAFGGKIATMSRISLRVPRKVFNLLNRGNTKGAALVQILAAILTPADKGILLSNALCYRTGCRGVRGGVKCLPRRVSLCPSLAIQRYLRCVKSLTKVRGERDGGEVSCCLRGADLTSRRGGGVQRLSNKVGQEIKLIRTLLRRPSFLVISRPAAKLSPRRHVHVHGLLMSFTRRHAMLFSARIIRSLVTAYGRLTIVGGNEFLCAKAVERLLGGTEKRM